MSARLATLLLLSALPAMSLDGTRFAFLNPERDQMRTADTDGFQRLVLQGRDLTRPSFDLSGWVWTVDHAQGTRVMAIDAGSGGAGDEATREISAEWIGDRDVSALRISRDGTRAAIVAGEGESTHLYLAGVIRDSEGVPRGHGTPVRLEPTVPVSDSYLNWRKPPWATSNVPSARGSSRVPVTVPT